jgi:ribosomal protein S18 acetylase RimI-like enzyme
MLFRRADVNDAARLNVFAEENFRKTFAPDNDPAQIELYCSKTYSTELQRAQIDRPDARVILAEDNDEIAGYVQMRLCSEPATVIFSQYRPAEIEKFYVAYDHHGTGLAQQLMAAAVELAQNEGADCLWLGVWKENKRGIAFYQKVGFRIIGEQTFMLGTEEQYDYVMSRNLK